MIAINARAVFKQPRTGLEEYAYQLILHVIKEARLRNSIDQLLLYAPTWAGMPQEFLEIPIKVIKAPFLWTQLRLAWQLAWDNPLVFFNPEQILPYGAPRNSVVTVHDVAYELHPRYYPQYHRRYLQLVTRRAVKHAKKIIAVSERTKRDISKFYGVSQRKIEVVYHGIPVNVMRAAQGEPLENINAARFKKPYLFHSKPYFLYVGRIEHKKNILGLIEAFGYFLAESGQDINLLLAGTPGFGFNQIMWRAKHSPYASAIVHLGYVSEQEKIALYKNAFALVFVSFYEGFGLPILEAQALGVPVIASDTSCFPEIALDSALLVNPEEPRTIAKAMRYLTENKKFASYLIKQGYANCMRFSWQTTARQTLDILLNASS